MYGCGCCSSQCERKSQCALYYENQSGMVLSVQNFYDYGCSSFSSEKSEALWWCGPHGNWGMFVDVKAEILEFVSPVGDSITTDDLVKEIDSFLQGEV